MLSAWLTVQQSRSLRVVVLLCLSVLLPVCLADPPQPLEGQNDLESRVAALEALVTGQSRSFLQNLQPWARRPLRA